jgi:hypothetical protein
MEVVEATAVVVVVVMVVVAMAEVTAVAVVVFQREAVFLFLLEAEAADSVVEAGAITDITEAIMVGDADSASVVLGDGGEAHRRMSSAQSVAMTRCSFAIPTAPTIAWRKSAMKRGNAESFPLRIESAKLGSCRSMI